MGLDRANQIDPVQQNRAVAQADFVAPLAASGLRLLHAKNATRDWAAF
jgi:hypothetical protein